MPRSGAASLLLGCALAGARAQSAPPLYDFATSPLVQLDDSNFEKLVTRDDSALWVVEFYADWCGHCQKFAKGYQKAAEGLLGIVKFGAVNADTAKRTANAAGVQGFPSVKLYMPGTGAKNPYTGKWFKPPIEYSGPRGAKSLADFAAKSVPSEVVRLGDADLPAFRANGSLPKAVLFTKKEETPPLLKAISTALKGRMLIGEARETASSAVAEFGVAEFPSLFMVPAEGEPPVVYDGELKPAPLTAYLEQRAGPPVAGAAEAGGAEPDSIAVAIGEDNVGELVDGSLSAWLLYFDGEAAEPVDVDALADALYGQAKVGRASAALRSKYGVKGKASAAALVSVPHGDAKAKADAKRVKSFGVDEANVAAARKHVVESIPDTSVLRVTTANMDAFMQASLTQSDAGAFAILFSDKSSVPPLYRALALEFDGKLGFGLASINDPQLAKQFNAVKAPTLLVMFPQPDSPEASSPDGEQKGVQLTGMQFNPQMHGKFNYGNLAHFAAQIIEMRLKQTGRGGDASADGGERGGAEPRARPSKKELGPLPELSASSFDSACGSTGALCAIAMLDGDASNGNKGPQLEMLTKLRQRRAGGPLAFSWLDATCHTEFAAAFGIYETDLPTMVVLSPSKLRWAKSIGAFDADNLGVFGSGVASGRTRTDPIDALPTLDPSVDCATVARGAAAVDDDPLGDDIMAEILEEERLAREAREAELAAEGVVVAPSGKAGADKSKMSELQRMEAELEECEAMDLLCSARREKQEKAIAKKRELEEKLAAIAKKKKKAKKKAAKAAKA